MDKKGKLSTLLFIGVTILPLLGLLIMDYQVRRANDITGAYLAAGPAAYAADNMVAGAVALGALVLALVLFTVSRVRKSRLVTTMPLSRINKDIDDIDQRLKDLER